MALDAGVARLNVVHSRRIQDVSACGMLRVLASWSVTLFAADVPFDHLFRLNVVVHRMAPITGGARRPLHVVRRIKRLPPVRSLGHEIGPPNSFGNVPLRGLGKIVASPFRKVALLPNAAVYKRDVLFRELCNGIRRKIWKYRVGLFARIADDIRHWRLSPLVVDFRMALLARLRAHVMS